MPVIKILEQDVDAQETIVEITTSLCETAPVSQVSLRAFCHMASLPVVSSKISLFGFLVNNIVSEDALQMPQKTNRGYFSYRLFARVLDTKKRYVQIGDINIELDCPLPKDIPDNSYISFDVNRLDLQSE